MVFTKDLARNSELLPPTLEVLNGNLPLDKLSRQFIRTSEFEKGWILGL